MTTTSFQNLIESIEILPVEDQDFLFELIRKRRIEKRRSEIAHLAQTLLNDLQEGKAKVGTIDDLMMDLSQNDDESSLE